MTSPIALLAPLVGADPAPAPLPAEDQRVFTAALIAALQVAMFPVPAPVVQAAAPAPASGAEDSGEGAGTKGEPHAVLTAVEQPIAPSETTRLPAQESRGSAGPLGTVLVIDQAPVGDAELAAAPSGVVPEHSLQATTAPDAVAPRLSIAVQQPPVTVDGGSASEVLPSETSTVRVAVESRAEVPAAPTGPSRAASKPMTKDDLSAAPSPNRSGGNETVAPSESDVSRRSTGGAPLPADATIDPGVTSTGAQSPIAALLSTPRQQAHTITPSPDTAAAAPAAARTDEPTGLQPPADTAPAMPSQEPRPAEAQRTSRPRDQERKRTFSLAVTPATVTPVAVIVPLPAGAALVVEARVAQALPEGPDQFGREPSSTDSSGRAAATGKFELIPPVSRLELPSGPRETRTGSVATSSNAGFFRAITAILGDPAISDVHVTEGKSAVTTAPAPIPSETTAPAMSAKAASVVAPTFVAADALASSPPVRRTREAVGILTQVPADIAAGAPERQEPQVLRNRPAGPPPEQRTLPASRQELPAVVERPERDPAPSSDSEKVEPAKPSDGGAGSSTSSPPHNAPLSGETIRSIVVESGEARNLPKGVPARESPAGLADRVTLNVADADGRQTRIRVAVLGDQVRAVIQPPDAEAARHLERRMDELQAALVRQGFVDPKLTVQLAVTSSEPAPTWGAAPGNGPSDPPLSRGTDQPPGDQRQGTGRREQGRQGDGQRHPQQRSPERDPEDRRR